MAKPEDIRDAALRATIEDAEQLIGDGKYLEAVQKCAEAYLSLVERYPDLVAPAPGRRSAWPQFGLRLSVGDDMRARLSYDKERFSFSEAATFLEFIIDQVVGAQDG